MTDAHPQPLRVGVVGVAGGWSSELLADAFAERTGHRLVIEARELVLDLDAETVRYRDSDVLGLDALVIKKTSEVYGPEMLDRLELLRHIAERGVPVFSRPIAMLRIADRLACTIGLRAAGVPMPPTVITEDTRAAALAVRRFETAVLKPLFSTKARGMRLVDASDEPRLIASLEEFRAEGNPIFYIQKKVEIPGHDLGVVFIGRKYVGTYARKRAAGAWNTTTASGGRYEAYEPSREVLEVAERAARAFGLDFTGVDVVETANGPLVFEVSAFGGFRGLREAHGMDPAALYAEHVLSVLGRR